MLSDTQLHSLTRSLLFAGYKEESLMVIVNYF